MVLQVLRTADMITVTMADDHVFDIRRIEPELFKSADDLVFDRVLPDRIDDDDASRSCDRPRRNILLADEVKIVEHLCGLHVPLRSGWRCLASGLRVIFWCRWSRRRWFGIRADSC